MNVPKVLLVEDSASMRLIVEATIGSICQLTSVDTIGAAQKKLNSDGYSLLLLDVTLPDGDGFEYCKTLRRDPRFHDLPIIFLTGATEVGQRVQGFDLGADDYITKPFEPNEFRARIGARLKRDPSKAAGLGFSCGPFTIDFPRQRASVNDEGGVRELNLTPIEFKLLAQLIRHEGKVFSREELLSAVWGTTVHVSGHTVDTHMSSLRKKVGEHSHWFKSIVKKGYCFSQDTKSGKLPA